ncbi:hypothetical protein [Methylotenera sp.]|uniref:hypothetical protein n=1 Tax=Methylotenera sp. TaxID=2051956 RepID=UPI002487C9FA|nr:hypothetical protein [Methylotenera sp.]MDI1362568.1 hypothetical protein [Methylotenera sp.]
MKNTQMLKADNRLRAKHLLEEDGFTAAEIRDLLNEPAGLRDEFAKAALAGQISYEGMEGCDAKFIAAMTYELADAMMGER